jgi:hypothetical protein
MRIRRVLIVWLVLAAAAGGSVALLVRMSGGEEVGTGERDGSRADAARTTAAGNGFLVVDQQLEGLIFTEGAFSFVRLETEGSGVVVERLVRDTRRTLPLLRRRLAPGRYRLTSHQRPCEGVCPASGSGGLDPPTAGCTTRFEIKAG